MQYHKMELEKVENLVKEREISQHSQTLNNVSQGFEFLERNRAVMFRSLHDGIKSYG